MEGCGILDELNGLQNWSSVGSSPTATSKNSLAPTADRLLDCTVKAGDRMKADKKRRAGMRISRKKLRLKQSELAALAGVSLETIIRYERCKHVSPETDSRIGGAILRMVMKKYPQAVKRAVQPFLEEAEKWEKIHSVEPGSQLALELERLNGKTLAEMKAQAEGVGIFRRAANNFLSLTE